ncbi:MAG: ATP-binding protein [bacterium]|nr:ATP-binding protein [bacterium]
MENKRFKINYRIKFILKHILILLAVIIVQLFVINHFYNIAVLDKRFGFILYFFLIIPTILLYGIIVGLFKLVFNRFNLRKANKFQARLILAFSFIALIPIIPLTILTNNLLNKSLEIWLTKSIEESLSYGLDFVSNILEERKEHVRFSLNQFKEESAVRNSLVFGKMNQKSLNTLKAACRNSRIDSLFLIGRTNAIRYEYQQTRIIRHIFDKAWLYYYNKRTPFVQMSRENDTEYVIGYTPVFESGAGGDYAGGLVLVKLLPGDFSDEANKIANSLQAYKQMELYKKPVVKGLTTLLVIIMTLTVFFIAIIVSYFLSRSISEPIKILLDGTKRIASGDLSFEISYNAKDEIKLLINSFNQMTKELLASKQALIHTQRLSAWRDIAQRMAHEIRNPLTPIRLSIERLQKKIGDENFPEIFDKSTATILEEVKRLELLIKEFSEFAKIPQLSIGVKNLNHVVIDTLNVFSGLEHIRFTTDLEKDLPLINIDDTKIKEVIINLLNNSVHALKDIRNASIRIRTYSKFNIFGRFVYLEIEDNGKGIPPEEIDKIFDPYFTTKEEGTGLGLSIVEKIVSEHHSKITCESQVNAGSKFTIEFPC